MLANAHFALRLAPTMASRILMGKRVDKLAPSRGKVTGFKLGKLIREIPKLDPFEVLSRIDPEYSITGELSTPAANRGEGYLEIIMWCGGVGFKQPFKSTITPRSKRHNTKIKLRGPILESLERFS